MKGSFFFTGTNNFHLENLSPKMRKIYLSLAKRTVYRIWVRCLHCCKVIRYWRCLHCCKVLPHCLQLALPSLLLIYTSLLKAGVVSVVAKLYLPAYKWYCHCCKVIPHCLLLALLPLLKVISHYLKLALLPLLKSYTSLLPAVIAIIVAKFYVTV